jgi:hypothetical protein
MRRVVSGLAIALLCPSLSLAQATPPTATAEWELSASMYFFQVVDDRNYAQPTITADRGGLHLEARFNYEDADTGSLWLGYNISGGGVLSWEFTPMLGGVFGATDAVAPGYRGSLAWRALEFYSEGEYVIPGAAEDRFFYNWSELTVSPAAWLRLGVVTQRTRLYEAESDLQLGLLAGFSYKSLATAFHLFNPEDTHPVLVFSAAFEF